MKDTAELRPPVRRSFNQDLEETLKEGDYLK
jgi:hypothetical protein